MQETIDTRVLQEELEHFKTEKEKIRNLIGQIGGKNTYKRDKTINIIFIVFIGALFLLDILRHTINLNLPLPPLFSLELGLLFISIKIIWMMHQQSRVGHFQFWILNSIEFRLNSISKRLDTVESKGR